MRPIPRSISLVVCLFVISVLILAPRGAEPAITEETLRGRDELMPSRTVGVGEDLAAREYWITWQDQTQLDEIAAAWHAPNRAQGFRAYFTPDGFHMAPRTAERPDWVWGLSLEAHGRGSGSQPIEPARLTPNDSSIELDHRGIV